MPTLQDVVSDLSTGRLQIIDLTAPLSEQTPVLQLPEPFANTATFRTETISAFDAAGPAWAWSNITLGEHTGTHLDAPIHWVTGRDGKAVHQIEPARLVGPAVVIDLSAEAAADPDVLLEPAHLEAWEAQHGPLPQNCWVLLRTGWSERNTDARRFLNADENGPHTPGPSVACARWLAEHPAVSGFGVETVGIDAGAAGGFEPSFPVHHYLLGNDRYGLTSLINLDRLPPSGALLVVAPLPIVGGTGSPARVYALVERP